MAVPAGLRGHYRPFTDHLRFNQCIPDGFPFIDYEVRVPEDLASLAVLVEEFLHRCQWAATPFGLVFRASVLVQTRQMLTILRALAADRSLRLPAPWFTATETGNADVDRPLRVLVSLELLQRLLLGVPLGRPSAELRPAIQVGREALERLSPLAFGTFESWNAEDVVYRSDGSTALNRSTREIMESHASAYAVELLRACSPGVDQTWFEQHTERNRVGFYAALDELTKSGRSHRTHTGHSPHPDPRRLRVG